MTSSTNTDRASRWAGVRVTHKNKTCRIRKTWREMEAISNITVVYHDLHSEYCTDLGIDTIDFLAPTRGKRHISDARLVAMVAMRRKGASLMETARIFGRVNHTTVLNAERRVRESINTYGQDSPLSDLLVKALKVYAIR